MTTRAARALRLTAIHEAGHVAASFATFHPFKYVTIEPDPDQNSIGRVQGFGFSDAVIEAISAGGDPESDATLRDECIVLWAGPVAERKARGRWNWVGASHDMDMLMEIVPRLVGDTTSKAGRAFSAYLRYSAEALIEREWHIVKAVADALMDEGRLDYQSALAIRESVTGLRLRGQPPLTPPPPSTPPASA